eukprot:964356-Lingulodinium_polyedra.AAC.1
MSFAPLLPGALSSPESTTVGAPGDVFGAASAWVAPPALSCVTLAMIPSSAPSAAPFASMTSLAS